jgi:hypothetical protein
MYATVNLPGSSRFQIIREMTPEWGESCQLFGGADDYNSYTEDLNPEWPDYPETEDATLEEVIEWLSGMSEHGQIYILRNAIISDEDRAAIKAAI